MRIITVPEHKKLQKLNEGVNITNSESLNEGFFDDEDNDIDDVLNIDTFTDTARDEYFKEIEKDLLPKVEKWLKQYHITAYEIECTGHGIMVDVHDHVYLANYKLMKFPDFFIFRQIDGNFNVANNLFKSFKGFPLSIKGDLQASFNYIKDFSYVPHVLGTVFAEKQRVHTKYPLSNKNYLEYKKNPDGFLEEKQLVELPGGVYGNLIGINESAGTADVFIDGGSFNKSETVTVPMSDVDVLDSQIYLNQLL